MPYDARIDSRMEYYTRPATGYQVILLTSAKGRYWTLYTVIEYLYGSRYSCPAASEAEARQMAVEYAMTSIVNHWSRSAGTDSSTRMDARIYPFGGLIGDMRLRRPQIESLDVGSL